MANKLLCYGLITFLLSSATSVAAREPPKEDQKMEKKNPLTFEEAWPYLQEAFNNLTSMAEGSTSYHVTLGAYMSYYKTVYEACVSNPAETSPRFYAAYKRSFEDYITSKILPSLEQARNDEDFVADLAKSWSNYKLVTSWFSRFLKYLDRYYVPRNNLPSLEQASYSCFYDKIYAKLNDQIRDAVLVMIGHERRGNKIDQKLLKDILDMYVHMEESLNKHISSFSNKSSGKHDMKQVVECLEGDGNRDFPDLQGKSRERLLKAVEDELLKKRASKLVRGEDQGHVQKAVE